MSEPRINATITDVAVRDKGHLRAAVVVETVEHEIEVHVYASALRPGTVVVDISGELMDAVPVDGLLSLRIVMNDELVVDTATGAPEPIEDTYR